MSELFEIHDGEIKEMEPENIDLHKSGYFSYKDDKIEVNKDYETEEVDKMDEQTKFYIDQRINGLEKTLDQKFEHQQNIFSEKIDHLSTKNEKLIGEKFTEFKESTEINRKEDRKFYIGTGLAVAAVVVGILGFIF